MLALTRRVAESVVIGDEIVVRILSVKGAQVRLGIEAPKSVEVVRAEDRERVQRMEDADRKE